MFRQVLDYRDVNKRKNEKEIILLEIVVRKAHQNVQAKVD